ncbi:MAG: type III-B CRISPR module-associated Cmr3 family protein [Desulfococcaceae bacterium]
MWLFMKPLDTVCCRDSRPFAAGEHGTARTVFPPRPSTFYGALRSELIAAHGNGFADFHRPEGEPPPELAEAGTPRRMGTLRLNGIGLAEFDEGAQTCHALFPAPAHLVREHGSAEEASSPRFHRLRLAENGPLTSDVTDLSLPLQIPMGPDAPFQAAGGYLTAEAANRFLADPAAVPDGPDEWRAGGDLSAAAFQVGLTRVRGARVAAEGRLYSIEHRRLLSRSGTKTGFCLRVGETRKFHAASEGVIRLGGEGRAAAYRGLDHSPAGAIDRERIAARIANTGRFFLWLITPALFPGGWRPPFLTGEGTEGELEGVKVRLTAVRIPEPVFLGGFRLGPGASGESKPGFWAVETGSVYFFDLIGTPAADAVSRLVEARTFYPLPGQIGGMEQQGFGATLIGGN